MEKIYAIQGMTCGGCKSKVEAYLTAVDGVKSVHVSLENAEATIEASKSISLEAFAKALPDKYSINEKKPIPPIDIMTQDTGTVSKWKQLRPLFLIFAYITVAAIGIHFKDWNINEVMLDFMGLFYIVFSFFKFLDLKGFKESFGMYDPLAKAIPAYGWIYPFLELSLGLMFLLRFEIDIALVATLVLLGLTTIGVTRTLMDKKTIQCACLGTALKLPMTEATFIENAIMILMALFMLFN